MQRWQIAGSRWKLLTDYYKKNKLVLKGDSVITGGKMVVKADYFKKLCLIPVFALLLTLLSGCWLLPKEDEVLAPPVIEQQEVSYKTEAVKRGYMEKNITVTGYFVPVKMEPHYFSHGGGRIKQIYVAYGDEVKKGDLLAELLTGSLEEDIIYQQIEVDSKISSLENYKKISAVDLETAKDALAALEDKYATMMKSPDSYSVEEIKRIEDNISAKRTDLKKLELDIQNQVEQRTNEIEVARIKLDLMKQELEKSKLYAKIDGRVTYLSDLSEGDYIDTNTSVMSIADDRELQVQYTGREAPSFKPGMKVEITIKNEVYTAEVAEPPSSGDEASGWSKDAVRFKMDKIPDGVKKDDMVKVKLVLETRENALMVPRRAVRMYMGNKIVYVYEDGIRTERTVTTGIDQGSMIEIVDGLTEGEFVITE